MMNLLTSRRYFLKTAGLMTAGAILGPLRSRSGNAELPNILCITCEDISPFLGCFGDNIAKTPNLDALAAEGVKYTHLFACAGVCAPSRFSLITGMYPSSSGANHMRTSSYLPAGIPAYEAVPAPEVKCISEYLRANGYYCTNNQKTDYQFRVPVTAWDDCSEFAHWKNRPAGMPFFSIFNLMTTHESQIWDRAHDPVTIRPEDVTVPPYFPDTPKIRRDIARVYNNITIMDREAGELIDEIKTAGLLEKTIIIFYSDHGGPLPRGKRELNDTGLNAPMLIRFPGQKQVGTTVTDLISFVDIPATILSLAGIQPPDYLHGRAFAGKYQAASRNYIFAARDRMDSAYDVRRAVRDRQFKYIRNYKPEIGCYQDVAFRKKLGSMQDLLRLRDAGKLNRDQMYWFRSRKAPEELYLLAEDPYELNNLAENPAFRDDLMRLRQVHEEWLGEIGDQPLQSEKDLVWSMWPSGIQPVTAAPEFKMTSDVLSIQCSTPGASVAWQVNEKGLNPKHWFLYHKPIKINKGDTISAKAIRIGYRESRVTFLKN